MIATGRQDARAAIVATLLVTLAVALLPTGSYPAYLLVWLAVATVAALNGIAPAHIARRALVALPFFVATLPSSLRGVTRSSGLASWGRSASA